MADPPSARPRVHPSTLLGRVVVILVIGGMALQQIGASESFPAHLATEALAQGVGLDMSRKMFRATVTALAVGALVETLCERMAIRRRRGLWGLGGDIVLRARRRLRNRNIVV